MSVVPYNRIIASLPTSNSLVLYNTADNSLEVLSNIKERHKSPSSGSSLPSPSSSLPSALPTIDAYGGNNHNNNKHSNNVECPRCGFQWVDAAGDDAAAVGDSTGIRHNSRVHMDNDYFKLLQLNFATNSDHSKNLPHQKFIENEQSGQYIRLSESLFTQGYFNKFFKILKKLGTGSNGTVYKVEHSLNDLSIGVFALKKIGIGEDANNLANVLKEVQFLYNLTNADLFNNIEEDPDSVVDDNDDEKDLLMAVDGERHLIKYNHVWLEIDHASTFGPRIPCVFILFEYCDGGDLENYINDNFNNDSASHMTKAIFLRQRRNKSLANHRNFLNNFEIFKIFKDICFGVYQLHKSHIIHRDLKPSNCLLKQRPRDSFVLNSVHDLEKFPDVVVSDFGESTIEGTRRNSSGYTGTLEFTSPELLFKIDDGVLPNFDKKSDVFSMGLILYFLCFNKLPYHSNDQVSVREEIKKFHQTGDTRKFLFGDDDENDDDKKISKIRPIYDYINDDYKDGLLIDFINLIETMCDPDPQRRPNVDQIIISLVENTYWKLESYTQKRDKSDDDDEIVIEPQVDAVEEEEKGVFLNKRILLYFTAVVGFVPSVYLIRRFDCWQYAICFILGVVITKLIL